MNGVAKVVRTEDNVANMVGPGRKGQRVNCVIEDRFRNEVLLLEDVPANHKFALRYIGRGEPVIKYGCPIGTASRDIRKGEYVHIHNVESKRGRGDLARLSTGRSQQMEKVQCL